MKKMMAMTVAAVVVMGLTAGCAKPPPVLQANPAQARVDADVTLKTALDSPDWSTRARAVEALAQVEGPAAGRLFVQALGDREPAVRFAAAVAIGDTAYEPAKSRLLEMASTDSAKGENDRRVYAGVLYALWRLGDSQSAYNLATMLRDAEWQVRDNVALVLGRMHIKGVAELLKAQLALEIKLQPEVEMRLVESLAQLGDPRSRELLLAYVQTQKYEGQDLQAMYTLGKVGGPHAKWQLRELTKEDRPAYLRLAAMAALADLDVRDDDDYHYAVRAMTDTEHVIVENRKLKTIAPDEVNSVRYLAVLALGRMNRPLAVDVLLPALQSESGPVRVAAAMSILQLLPVAQTMPEAADDTDDTVADVTTDVMSDAVADMPTDTAAAETAAETHIADDAATDDVDDATADDAADATTADVDDADDTATELDADKFVDDTADEADNATDDEVADEAAADEETPPAKTSRPKLETSGARD